MKQIHSPPVVSYVSGYFNVAYPEFSKLAVYLSAFPTSSFEHSVALTVRMFSLEYTFSS